MIKKPTAYNRAYLVMCPRHFAQIQPYGWTSDTLGTLYEITPHEFKRNNYINRMALRVKGGEINGKNKEI
jgi:hypothetical protein